MGHSRDARTGRIVFLEPKAPDLHIFSTFNLPRLGTIILGTMLHARGHDVTVVVEEIQPAQASTFDGAWLVGISTTTSTAPRAYAWADWLRARGVVVVMGGPHVSYLPEEALRHADYVVVGEAEPAIVGLVEALQRGEQPQGLPGVLSQEDQGRVVTRGTVEDLDSLPIPDFTLVEGMDGWTALGRQKIIPMQATRGCPFDCSFCSVTGMFGRKMRIKSVRRVLEEVERFDDPKYHLFFYDDNLAARRRWFKELMEAFVERGYRFNWSAQMRIETAKDPELLELMARSRCTTAYIGIESVDPAALRAMDKRQTPDDIIAGTAALQKHGVGIHGMFILGLDTDTERSMEATVAFAKEAVTTSQFLILSPFPGTRTYRELASGGRILFDDWSLYDAHHVTFRPALVDALTLQEMQLWAHKEFYSLPRTLARLVKGELADAAVYTYARHHNQKWRRENVLYMQALELITRSHGIIKKVDYQSPANQIAV